MKNKAIIVVLVVLVVIGGLILSLGTLAAKGMSFGTKVATGMTLKVGAAVINPFTSTVDIKGVVLKNPKGFDESAMLKMPQFRVQYDIPALFKKVIHIPELEIYVEELNIVKNKEGETNIAYLKNLAENTKTTTDKTEKTVSQPKEKKKINLEIDYFHLKVDRVVYTNYATNGAPSVRAFTVGIDKEYYSIKDVNALILSVVTTSMMQTPMANLKDIGMGDVSGVTQQLFNKLDLQTIQISGLDSPELEGAKQKVVDSAADAVKKLLPF